MGCCDNKKQMPASGCCGSKNNEIDIRRIVQEGYGQIAQQGGSLKGGVASAEAIAVGIGYDKEELAALPEQANMGLSCGNPTAMASLKPGEVVLDLGSGGGLDVFLAAKRVGPGGKAIGVDMTPDMLTKARNNAEKFKEKSGLDNTDFRLGEIENLPVADSVIDVVISNCVINLSPYKKRVWQEIYRVLKPGGRVCVSDIALLQPLPEVVIASMKALIGCVAGAVLVEETERMMQEAGFTDIQMEYRSEYIDQMHDWSDPLFKDIAANLPENAKPSEYITSLSITAAKAAV